MRGRRVAEGVVGRGRDECAGVYVPTVTPPGTGMGLGGLATLVWAVKRKSVLGGTWAKELIELRKKKNITEMGFEGCISD